MSKQYILAIDGGTQSTKVALFDTVGREICSHTVKLRPMVLYGDNRAEHPDDDLWDSLKLACHKVFEKFEGDKAHIIGVGMGSIRCCRALLKEDGSLVSPVQSWMDLRLSRPYEHDDDTVKYVTTTTGYLTHRLTGETKDTRSNYVGPWPIDPVTLEWIEDQELFDSFTTPREMLFGLVDPASVLGTINEFAFNATGIPQGTPVVSTANDKAVEGLGAGLVNDGTVLVSLGTYITSMMIGDENKTGTSAFWSNPGAAPGEFLYESSGIRRGMATVTWIKELLGGDIVKVAEERGITPEAYLNKLAADDASPGCDGLYTVLHWLARPTHLHERGMMIGFNGSHKGHHMFRSVLEGIAMTMKNNAQAMCDERGVGPTKLIVSGGGSNGDLFMQIFADVFGVPALRNEVNGSASTGAAICVAMALGIYKDRQESIDKMVRQRDLFTPIPENVALYKEINERVYKHLATETDAILKKSHQIFNS
ncbi:FGGY-family carbohydrate kinase [Pseudovibrio sp. Tun.PSC04-5.I4]|uniref:FGGY-family carbohydrate kinase n=1 Tax=Pseudovibrio sp. Tun.PSC04-5.I4 TaxID=1798213 RepID=UPI0008868FBD|nr:FGGY-family carbohydrate kinase [Pseudovibrio sp. Tun.PSC04-5.I4]SDQ15670.1 Sugar (pentulose or hexulose) kinase [Pseudovibrio sp. Tun.PSC04-5.I4]